MSAASGREADWGGRWDSNPRRPGSQPGALPTELRPPLIYPLPGIPAPGIHFFLNTGPVVLTGRTRRCVCPVGQTVTVHPTELRPPLIYPLPGIPAPGIHFFLNTGPVVLTGRSRRCVCPVGQTVTVHPTELRPPLIYPLPGIYTPGNNALRASARDCMRFPRKAHEPQR